MSLNGISTLSSKQLKQEAKLSLAAAKRLAATTTYAGTGNVVSVTTSPIVTGNAIPLSAFLTQATVGAILKTAGGTTIGTISSIQTNYQLTLTANAATTQATTTHTFTVTNNGHRTLNVSNINILPTKYVGNVILDNRVDGNVLIVGRPWTL